MDAEYPYKEKRNRWSSHSVIAEMLEGLPRGTRVLDVGVASGMLASLCAGRGYVMRGVEPNPVNLAGSPHLYSELSTQSLEQTSDEFLAGHGAVVCGDVLEHLVFPEYQLIRLASLQDTKCRFIVSVPNITNLWIRLNLLLGKFEYTDRGILDRTHLHFYTRKSFQRPQPGRVGSQSAACHTNSIGFVVNILLQ
jgi:2-polyprenyl-3-methyl-5-hydroxy-6-metoxy-1,4-benzoquinol methylase